MDFLWPHIKSSTVELMPTECAGCSLTTSVIASWEMGRPG